MMTINLRVLATLCITVFILQGCSTSERLSSKGARTYSKPFSFIEKAVKGAVNGSGLEINGVSKSSKPKETTFELIHANYSNSKGTPKQLGSVTILKRSESKTQVEIVNPEYDYTVPSNHQLNYKVILFPRIEKLIEINS